MDAKVWMDVISTYLQNSLKKGMLISIFGSDVEQRPEQVTKFFFILRRRRRGSKLV